MIGIGGGIRSVHRSAWELAHGCAVPAGMFVLHRCDVRCCIEPSHLFLGKSGGQLASAAALSVLGGANEALLGNEVIQFKNAVLTAPSTYALSGFLRARRGTDWATPNHIVGERFIMLPASMDVPSPSSDLGVTRAFKAVSAGNALANAKPVQFVNNGAALAPYSPANLGGGTDAAGNVTLKWQRRTRIGGAWVNFNDVPLSEASELYVVQIWDSTYTYVARVITGVTSPTTIYTSAQQVADFGAQQQTIFFTVGQVGSYSIGHQTRGTAAGLGGSNGTVLAPVPPYQAPPPRGGSTCPAPVTNNSWTWSAPVRLINTGFAVGQTWLITFTTPVSPPAGLCRISGAEYGGNPCSRTAVLSLSPCGPPVAPGATSVAFTINIGFFFSNNPWPAIYPTLLPNTTYYLITTTELNSGMFYDLNHP